MALLLAGLLGLAAVPSAAADLTVTTTASAVTSVGKTYRQTTTVSGQLPVTYSIDIGPPAGLSIDPATGTVSGIPTIAGKFLYRIIAIDGVGDVGAAVVTGTFDAAVSLVALAYGTHSVGQPYLQRNLIFDGHGPYTFAITSGALPPGTELASGGAVFGTPTTAGPFSYQIQVTDNYASPPTVAIAAVSGTIAPPAGPLTLASAAPSGTVIGLSYNQTNVASGGIGPYTYAVTGGTLPAGVALDPYVGRVSGTPTAKGPFSYTIEVTDSSVPALTATQTVSGTIGDPLTLTSTPSGVTQVGKPYAQANLASGGVGPYTYTVEQAATPPGTAIDPATGTVSGTPIHAGSFGYAVRVTDSSLPPQTALESVNGTMAAPEPLILTSTPSALAKLGQAYTQANVASGGTAPYTYSIIGGGLEGTAVDPATGTVSGTPTKAGSFGYTILAADSSSPPQFVTQTVSGTIAGNGSLTITSTPSGVTKLGKPYFQVNSVSGGLWPYTFVLQSGSLPAGTSLDSGTGLVSGAPTAAGAFSYSIKVTDSSLLSAISETVSGTIANAPLSLTSVPSGVTQVGKPYAQTNVASGGTAPYQYSVDSLPAGLTLDTATGTISGAPTTAGAFSYTVTATDASSPVQSATQPASGFITELGGALTLTSTPSGVTQIGKAYAQTNVAGGGTGPYTYALVAGALPPGTALDAATGMVSGTPSVAGSFGYTIEVTDSSVPAQTARQATSGTMSAAGTPILTSTPSGVTQQGKSYAQTNVASGGTAPYTYALVAGALPPGIALDAASGTVSGTPSVAGSFGYTIEVTDSSVPAQTAQQATSGTMSAASALILSSTPSGLASLGQVYSQINATSGGTAPYTYSIIGGGVPEGTSLDPATGTVAGVPTKAGPFGYSILAIDSGNPVQGATQTVSGTIAGNGNLTLTSTPSGVTQRGQAYFQTNIVSGGVWPYTFVLQSGNLPAGTSLDSTSGTVSGAPTATGDFSYSIKVTDSSLLSAISATVSGTITITPLVLLSTESGATQVGKPYAQANVARGGTAPYTYTLENGPLPAGLTLDAATGTVSGTPTLAGAFLYQVKVTDSNLVSDAGFTGGTIDPAAPLSLISTASAVTQLGKAYAQANAASGGIGAPYVYSLHSGTLPAGTGLDAATGMVSGTPTTVGAFSYSIAAEDSTQLSANGPTVSGAITDIGGTLTLASTPAAATQVRNPYAQTNMASGGTGPYSFSLLSGNLPAGTALDAATGTVSGTPTTAGAFGYTVQVSDSSAPVQTATGVALSGTIAPDGAALTLTSTPAAVVLVGETYSQTNVASGGIGPYAYSLYGGGLPDGTSLDPATGTVSGTPTDAATFAYIIKVKDSGDPQRSVLSRPITATIGTLPFVLSSSASAVAQVGKPYLQTNVASGGVGPYTYNSVFGGNLPARTSFDSATGTVSGTPTTAGQFSYYVNATDSFHNSLIEHVTGTIGAPDPVTLVVTPSAATSVGTPYSQTSLASSGTAPYGFALNGGALPAGTSLDPATGTVSGTPILAGPFSYTLQVTDSYNPPTTAAQTVSGTVGYTAGPLSLASMPSAVVYVGRAYVQTNIATGGTGPYTYALATGALPPGTALDTVSGTVAGTPTTVGAFSYAIKVTDSSAPPQSVTGATMSGTVADAPDPITVTSTAAPVTELGNPYSQTNVASGGHGPFVYAISAGALPAGTALNPATGTVSGTPTVAGDFEYDVQVTDKSVPPQTATETVSGVVTITPLIVTPTASSTLKVGQSYSQTTQARGGTAPYAYFLFGALPDGLTLDNGTGTVSGTPTTAGPFSYSIFVLDSSNPAQGQESSTLSGIIAGITAPTIISTPSAQLQVGQPFSQLNQAAGGTPTYTYALANGTLPAGLALDPTTGTVSGTPTNAGAFSYAIKVIDSNTPAQSATASTMSGTIVGAGVLTLTATASAGTQVGQAYVQTNLAVGGTPNYTYELANGTLPAGLSLDSGTGTVSGTPTSAGAFSYAIKVTDSSAPAQTVTGATVSGTIAAAPTTLTLKATASSTTQVGQPYAQTNVASGGTTPYLYGVTSGTLPDGLTIDSATGTVSGTPTKAGPFSYGVSVGDSGHPQQILYDTIVSGTIASAGALTITPTPSATTQVGQAYAQANVAAGGTGPYTYTLASGTLPPGTSLDAMTGLASGTPTTAGAFSYAIKVTDSGAPAQSATGTTLSGTILVAVAALTITPTPSTTTQVGQAYAQANVAAGGTGPYTYTLASGTLPAGTSLDATTGLVSGTPTTAGPFSYAIKVTDSSAPAQSATGSIVNGNISAAPEILTITPNSGSTLGGTPVTITGTGFTGATAVTFGGTTATGITVVNDTTLTATTPAHASGAVAVAVTAPGGNVSLPNGFTYAPQGPTVASHTFQLLAGTTGTVDLTQGAAGAPFTAAAIVTPPPTSDGTANIVHNGTQWQLVYASTAGAASTVIVRYTLSNVSGRSAPGTVTFTIITRPDPSRDPEVIGLLNAQAQSAQRFAQSQITNFRDRLEQLHDDSSREATSMNVRLGIPQDPNDPDALGYTEDNRPYDPTRRAFAHAPDDAANSRRLSGKTPPPTSGSPSDLAFWAGGFINFGTSDTYKIDLGHTLVGVSGGMDYRFSPSFTAGIGLGYGRDTVDVGTNGTQSRGQAFSTAIYGSYHPHNNIFVDGLLGYSALDFGSKRFVTPTGGFAIGDRSGSQVFGSISSGYEYKGDGFLVSPYGRIEAAWTRLNGFTEGGASPYDLTFGDQTLDMLSGVLGLRAEYAFPQDWGLLKARGRLEYTHDFSGSSLANIGYADLNNGLPYSLNIDGLSRDYLAVGLGFDASLGNGATIGFDYTTAFSFDGNSQAHNFSLRFGAQF